MKRSIFKGMMCLLLLGVGATSVYAQQQQRKDTLVVARDGTGEYRNIQEAVELSLIHISFLSDLREQAKLHVP